MKKGQRKWLAGAVVLAVAFGGAQLLRPVGEPVSYTHLTLPTN